MTYQEALEIVVARTGHETFRKLCSDENHNIAERDKFRRAVIGMAAPKPVRSAIAAVGRVAEAAIHGQPIWASEDKYNSRIAICIECPEYEPKSVRCKKCTCFLTVKARLETEDGQCPLGKW